MPPATSLVLRLSGLSAAIFLVLAVHQPFFPVFLAGRGFDASTVGILLAAPVFVRVFATPIVAGLGDRHFSPKSLLVATHVGLAGTYLAMLFADGFWPLLLLNLIAGFLHGGIVPLQDILLMREITADRRLNYGRLRLWGSISFMGGNVLAGLLLAKFPVDSVVVMLAVSCVIAAGVASVQPVRFDVPVPTEETIGPSGGRLVTPFAVVLVAGIALSHASHAGINGFGTLNWQRQGYSVQVIGVLWAFSFVAEMIVFWRAGALVSRLDNALIMLAIGAGVSMLRWLAMALEPGLALSALLQATHAVSFGFTHLAGIAAIGMISPSGRRSTAMGLAGGSGAFISGVAMLAAGRLYDVSAPAMFATMAGIAGVSLGCYGLLWVSRRG